MPPLNEIELPFNLLATFVSTFLPSPWPQVISVMIVSFIVMMFLSKRPRFKFKYTWLTTFGVPLLVGVLAFFFIPQQPRPGIPGEKVASSDVSNQPGQVPVAPNPLFSLHGDDRHDKLQFNFFCGVSGPLLESNGAHNNTDADHNTIVMGNCPFHN
jgi:hypothetical protein